MQQNLRRLPICFGLLFIVGCMTNASPPLDDAILHANALRFGTHVGPDAEKNPIIPPERFAGYHAGLDYEILPEQFHAEVPVYAVCTGMLLYSGFAEGYGGLVVQRCTLASESVTILYGHLDEALPTVQTNVRAGDQIGRLAPAYSHWSDGNRKHLHLGIHKGEDLVVLGYVQNPEELEEFIDPTKVFPQTFLGYPVDTFEVPEEQRKN